MTPTWPLARPRVVCVLPGTGIYGGVRVVFEIADALLDRGYEVQVVGPEPAPDWHEHRAPYRQVDLAAPGAVPAADICIATFWTTVAAGVASGSTLTFQFCQGFEGVHREYAPLLPRIDATYRLPIPKLVIARHLETVLLERYGIRPHWLGQSIDTDLFRPGELREAAVPLRVGVVGPYGLRPKGIGELLAGLGMARERGLAIEVHHASSDPMQPGEAAMGVTDRFHHHLSTRQMAEFYRGVDVYFHPSHDEEGYPLPPLEAMACGVPVALTTIRSFSHFTDAEVLRFPPGTPEAIPPLVERFLDPDLRRRMRAAGLECARSHTRAKLMDRLEAAFAAEWPGGREAPRAGGLRGWIRAVRDGRTRRPGPSPAPGR